MHASRKSNHASVRSIFHPLFISYVLGLFCFCGSQNVRQWSFLITSDTHSSDGVCVGRSASTSAFTLSSLCFFFHLLLRGDYVGLCVSSNVYLLYLLYLSPYSPLFTFIQQTLPLFTQGNVRGRRHRILFRKRPGSPPSPCEAPSRPHSAQQTPQRAREDELGGLHTHTSSSEYQ